MDWKQKEKENSAGGINGRAILTTPVKTHSVAQQPPPVKRTVIHIREDDNYNENDNDHEGLDGDVLEEPVNEFWRSALDLAESLSPLPRPDDDEQLPISELIELANTAHRDGNLWRARDLWTLALSKLEQKSSEDDDRDHLQRRLSKVHRQLSKVEMLEEDFVRVIETGDHALDPFRDESLFLEGRIYQKLFLHQKLGIKWMWGLHLAENGGGILGDDMGLGKTVQVGAFLGSLFYSELIESALIVVPKSLLDQWSKELRIWLPESVQVFLYHGNGREKVLREVQSGSLSVTLTTYGTVLTTITALKQHRWNYVVLDEGHKIRTHTTKQSRAIHELVCSHKLLLTGTPIMNNLRNLWALFDWVTDGALLGPLRLFVDEFERGILAGSDRTASPIIRSEALRLAHSLRKTIAPHFLRRDKKTIAAQLTVRKYDFVLWTKLSPWQRRLYKAFLSSSQVASVLNKTRSPLAAITVLKKISTHPALLKQELQDALKQGVNLETLDDELLDESDMENEEDGNDSNAFEQSSKLRVLLELLLSLRREGHKTLLFSMSSRFLDRVTQLLHSQPEFTWARLDGSVADLRDRARIVAEFSSSSVEEQFVLLCTTQACGLGLNLVVADRVILADPSWNALDEQAVDRVYRIGQNRDVIVYRLITCGTVEEHIYRKQIFKLALTRTMLADNAQAKSSDTHEEQSTLPSLQSYFSKEELHALFTLDEDGERSRTQLRLTTLATVLSKESHSLTSVGNTATEGHRRWLESLPMVSGLSDHHLLFQSGAENGEILADAIANWQNEENDRRYGMHDRNDIRNHQEKSVDPDDEEEEEGNVLNDSYHSSSERDSGTENDGPLLGDDELSLDDGISTDVAGGQVLEIDFSDSEAGEEETLPVSEAAKRRKSETSFQTLSSSSDIEDGDEALWMLKNLSDLGVSLDRNDVEVRSDGNDGGVTEITFDDKSDEVLAHIQGIVSPNANERSPLRAGSSPSALSRLILLSNSNRRKRLRRKKSLALRKKPEISIIDLSSDEEDQEEGKPLEREEERAKTLVLDLTTETDSLDIPDTTSESPFVLDDSTVDDNSYDDICFIDDDNEEEYTLQISESNDVELNTLDLTGEILLSPPSTPSGKLNDATPNRRVPVGQGITPPSRKIHNASGLRAPTTIERRLFLKKRDAYTQALVDYFNSKVFEGKLPADLRVVWSSRLRSTSGRAPLTRCGGVYSAHVELSSKVLDSYEKLFQTLCHELCHVAAWLIDHSHQPPHGGAWLKWMKHAKSCDSRININATHSYEIHHKLTYQCNNTDCGATFGRDSKVPKERLSRLSCARCLVGTFALVTGKKARAPNKFALFVQQNLGEAKRSNPHLTHADIMKRLSAMYSATKQ